VAERSPRHLPVARRGFGDLAEVEQPAGSARRRAKGAGGRRKGLAQQGPGRGKGVAGPAPTPAVIVVPRGIGYPRASMDRSLLPPLLAGPRRACLALADGTVFHGYASGGEALASGEVVFNTSMFGYQEMLTDPSYRGQILVLTTAHVGNVGVNSEDEESRRVWAEGLIVPDLTAVPSNWRAQGGLLERLDTQGVAVGWGFDTRALVLRLRAAGALPGVLVCGREPARRELEALVKEARGTDGCDLTRAVARGEIEKWSAAPWLPPGEQPHKANGGPLVAVVDCGVKHSILRHLVGAGAGVVVVPPDAGAASILALKPAGVVVSNGPGDPAAVAGVPQTIRDLLGKVPLLGICLGHQLLAVALGGLTYKLRFGHHGANHPVRDQATGSVWITSQNHNYAVDRDSLPGRARVSMVNLTDDSVEGIVAEDVLAEGIQFHPEAGPGPHDALGVFARFVWRCRGRR
jgi:carbamoyl-phosphate synthase small subunit